jgi:hypothetical protein
MKLTKQPRGLRAEFAANIVITDVMSEKQLSTRTSNLSVSGCLVSTSTPFNKGDNIRISIVHAGAKFEGFGRVIFANADGMGVAFTTIEPQYQAVLDRWMSDLRATNS